MFRFRALRPAASVVSSGLRVNCVRTGPLTHPLCRLFGSRSAKAAATTTIDWSLLTVEKLKLELKSRNLPVSGKKAELIARITQASTSTIVTAQPARRDASPPSPLPPSPSAPAVDAASTPEPIRTAAPEPNSAPELSSETAASAATAAPYAADSEPAATETPTAAATAAAVAQPEAVSEPVPVPLPVPADGTGEPQSQPQLSATFTDYFSFVNTQIATPRQVTFEAVNGNAAAATANPSAAGTSAASAPAPKTSSHRRPASSTGAAAPYAADAEPAASATATASDEPEAAPVAVTEESDAIPIRDRIFPLNGEAVSDFLVRTNPQSPLTRALYCSVLSSKKEHLRVYTQAEARPMEKIVDRILRVRSSLTSMKDVLSLANSVGVTNGKFVIPTPAGDETARMWERIASDTEKGRLGLMATINTALCLQVRGFPAGSEHRIFVYTHSMFDTSDKLRIRERLTKLGITAPIHYKPEVYTYLGFEYDNSLLAATDSTPAWVQRELS